MKLNLEHSQHYTGRLMTAGQTQTWLFHDTVFLLDRNISVKQIGR